MPAAKGILLSNAVGSAAGARLGILARTAHAAGDDRFEEKEHAITVFERHNQEVMRHVPAERLLVYEIQQGWEPLCRGGATAVSALTNPA